jgi:hypothetical protein
MTVLVALGLALSLATIEAPACAKSKISVRDEYRASDAVVIGTVLQANRVAPTNNFLDGTAYVIRVDQKLKGKSPSRIRLFSENSSARFPMRRGMQYLLFIDNLERSVIDNCGNSGTLSSRRKALALTRRLARDSLHAVKMSKPNHDSRDR